MRAIVVGAGLAGLAAADALAARGVHVVVLEARDRVGGRVWSRELDNGAVVEMGAEFVLPGADVLRGLVERFGLGFWDKGMRYGVREPRGGIGVELEALHTAALVVTEELERLGDAAGEMSTAELLDTLDLDPGAREAIEARVEVSAATVATDVSAHELAGVAAYSDADCPSIAGGNQRLAVALADALGEAVRLASPVERIAWGSEGVAVRAAGAEVTADACLLAIPATVTARIAFDPPLPERVLTSLDAIGYGHAAKLFVPLSRSTEPSATLSVPERYWAWTATAGDARVQPVVSAFAGSPVALERLAVAGGAETWAGSLARLRPDLELVDGGAVVSTWSDDPWARAAYSTQAPGPDRAAPLRDATGPILFAGEHTAGPYAGLMEGALRSGLRAAEQALAAHP